MESQINYFTNEIIDKLVVESKNPVNSLSIQIPFSYALKLASINWNDILFAITNAYFDESVAVEYALLLLEKGENDNDIIDLAILNPSEITTEAMLHDYISSFAKKVVKKEEAKEKIMYILLNLIFENKSIFEDPLRAVEIVYSDFGYPKSLENLIRYIPDGNCTEIDGEKKIYENWENYLNSQKIRFSI